MKSFIVGGYCRDKLLGIPSKDIDYVVVGSSIEEMLAQGFQQVGCDFPVFLHPETKHEYALARTERKSGNGYQGFVCDFNPSISIHEDLLRRDISINSIAYDEETNTYIDPCDGIEDIKNRVIRHTGKHFAEDPVRVLRVARFLARYHKLGFIIHADTLEYMKSLVTSGELKYLTKERIVLEIQKACTEDNPELFFETLYNIGAFQDVFGFSMEKYKLEQFMFHIQTLNKSFEYIIPAMQFYVDNDAFSKFMNKYVFPIEVKGNYIRVCTTHAFFVDFENINSAVNFYNLVGARRYNEKAVNDFFHIVSFVTHKRHLDDVKYKLFTAMKNIKDAMKKFTMENPKLEGYLIKEHFDKTIKESLI